MLITGFKSHLHKLNLAPSLLIRRTGIGYGNKIILLPIRGFLRKDGLVLHLPGFNKTQSWVHNSVPMEGLVLDMILFIIIFMF